MEPALVFYFVLAGAAGGLLLGLIGVGMALVTVPFLTFVLPVSGISPEASPLIALACSMFIVAAGSISSLKAHQHKGSIQWPLVRLMLPGSLLGVLLGSMLVGELSASWLQFIFASFLIYVAISTLSNTAPGRTVQSRQDSNSVLRWFSLLVGVSGSFIGAGGGVLMVPFLSRFLAMPQAVATSVAIGFPVTVLGALSFMAQPQPVEHAWMTGAVYWPAAIGMSVGSVLAAPLGVKFAAKVPAILLKRLFALILLCIAVRMFWSV